MQEILGFSIKIFVGSLLVAFIVQLFSSRSSTMLMLIVATVFSILMVVINLRTFVEDPDLLKIYGIYYVFSCFGALLGVAAARIIKYIGGKIKSSTDKYRTQKNKSTIYP